MDSPTFRHEKRRASRCLSAAGGRGCAGEPSSHASRKCERLSISKSGHLYSLLKATAFRAGVDLPERSAFHIFRHTYMTWMRRYAGLDELGLLNLGTHKDRKSVGRYTHVVVSEEARRAALLPVGKIRGIAS
jgi:integrase